jgi:hypothetical protein
VTNVSLEREATFGADTPVGIYWITRCHGFAVRGRGRRGVVEDVFVPRPGAAASFIVVRVRGLPGSRPRTIATAEITAVDPWRETIHLRSTIRACARRSRRQGRRAGEAKFA